MRKPYSEEFKKNILEKRSQGYSYSSLSKEYGVSQSTIFNWINNQKEENKSTPKTNYDISCVDDINSLKNKVSELEEEIIFLKKLFKFFLNKIDL